MRSATKPGGITALWRMLRRLAREQEGVAAVELALVTPFLVLLVVGVIDFGLAHARKLELAHGVRAGTQYAMIMRPRAEEGTAEIEAAILEAVPDANTPVVQFVCTCIGTGLPAPLCDPTTCGTGFTLNTTVEITLQENYPLLLSFTGLPATINLSESASVRLF